MSESRVLLSRRGDVGAGMPDRVWYAAYGSNMLERRLRCYLEGGKATASHERNPGARDGSAPGGSMLAVVDHGLMFGRHSAAWGGGVAFLDEEGESGLSYVRLWDLGREQFEDVGAQENGLGAGEMGVDWGALFETGIWRSKVARWYGTFLCFGEWEGRPVVTVTGDFGGAWSEPGEAYRSVILEGLREAGLDEESVESYGAGWSAKW